MSTKIKAFWEAHNVKILTVLAIILTAVVSFRAGQTHEKQKIAANIEVSINQLAAANPAAEKIKTLGEALERKGVNVNKISNGKVDQEGGSSQNSECALVGSKNSDKYHLPSCGWADKIKLENRVCFSSVEEAENKGYKPAGCCHK